MFVCDATYAVRPKTVINFLAFAYLMLENLFRPLEPVS
jgi:hypothetical protein